MGIKDWFRGKPAQLPARSHPRRGYAAASNIARYGDFRSSRGSADYELREGLAEVRAKVRYLARNSGTMKRFLQLLKVNVVGENGFRFQSRVKSVTGEGMNKSLNERVEQAWSDWSEFPTVDGSMSMTDLSNQIIQSWARDGEAILEIVYGAAYPDGIALNPLEADILDETLNTVHPPTGNEIRMGVEINGRTGAAVAYHFLTYHPGDINAVWFSRKYERQHRRVPVDRVIHLFERSRPGQTRGEPPAAPIVNSIKMLDGYREAETVGRRLRSALMGFFQRELPNSQQLDELSDRETEDDDDTPVFEMDMEPGRLKQLPDGLAFKEFSPGGSVTDYAEFEAQIKKDISMALGISTMALGMEVAGVSYSSGRTVIQEDRDYYKTLQSFVVRNAMVKIFRKWTARHVLADNAAFSPTQLERVMRGARFRARGWDWVDPAKDVRANAEALQTNQTSLTRIAAARGIDRDELLDEIADDKRALEERGLTVADLGANNEQTKDGEDDTDGKPE